MKVIDKYLLVFDGTNEVLYTFTDPRKFPITKHSTLQCEGVWYEVSGRSEWYTDIAQMHHAKENEKFLKELKRKMPYDEFKTSGIEQKIASCHYYRYMDIYIKEKIILKKI